VTPPRMISERAERLLRKEGVPEEQIERFRGPNRVWSGPLVGVTVNGQRVVTSDGVRELTETAVRPIERRDGESYSDVARRFQPR
jgi:hypothetical protein